MKILLLFCYYTSYPNGGWADYKGTFLSMDDARNHAVGDKYQIVDMETMKLVEYGEVGGKILPLEWVNLK